MYMSNQNVLFFFWFRDIVDSNYMQVVLTQTPPAYTEYLIQIILSSTKCTYQIELFYTDASGMKFLLHIVVGN